MSLSCPEPVSKYPSKTAVHHYRKAKNFTTFFQKDNKQNSPSFRYTSNSRSVRSILHPQNTNINHITSPVTERNTADKTDYTDNLYAAVDKSVIPFDVNNSQNAILKDEVADISSVGPLYERAEVIAKVHSDFNILDLKYYGALFSPSPQQSAIPQALDTLYLKDGSKVAGKLVTGSKKEYKLQSSNGMVFVFTSDNVEKVVIANARETDAEKPDTLGLNEMHGIEPYGLGVGIAGIIISIAGFITLKNFFWLGPSLGALAIILSSVSLRKIRRNQDKYSGKKTAIVGLTIGIAGIVLAAILVIRMIAGLA